MDTESKLFHVPAGFAVNVSATNLYSGEQFAVMFAVDVGHRPKDAAYTEYYENARAIVLDNEHNPLTLWRPGYYKLVTDGAVNSDVRVYVSATFPVTLGAVIDNVAALPEGT